MWNPFDKKSKSQPGAKPKPKKTKDELQAEFEKFAEQSGVDPNDMGMMQKFALKRLAKMSPEERQKLMQKAVTPKNIEKHKDEIIASLEAMKKAGQLSDDQYRLAKKRFGL